MTDDEEKAARALVAKIEVLRAENERLEALFQRTHGCHHSWVSRAFHLEDDVERLRAEVGQLHVLRADLGVRK